MEQPNLIKQLFLQLNTLIECIQTNPQAAEQVITPKLSQLKQEIKEINEQLSSLQSHSTPTSSDNKALEEKVIYSSQASDANKIILLEAKKLELKLRKIKYAINQKKDKQEDSQTEENKKQMKRRAKTFKNLGGDSKWIPL